MWASQNSWDKIQFGKEDKTSFADDIWCIVVTRGIHKVLLFENGQKKKIYLTAQMLICALDITAMTPEFYLFNKAYMKSCSIMGYYSRDLAESCLKRPSTNHCFHC